MADITIQKQGEVFISQSEYDALRLAGNLQSNTKYHITKTPKTGIDTMTNLDLTHGNTTVDYATNGNIAINSQARFTYDGGTTKDVPMKIDLPIVSGGGINFYKNSDAETFEVELDPEAATNMIFDTSQAPAVLVLGTNGFEYHNYGQMATYGFAEYTGDTQLQAATDDEEITDPNTDAVLVNKAYANKHYVPKISTAGTERCYTITPEGKQSARGIVANIADPYTVALRAGGGVLRVGTPVDANDATNKAYVDAFQTITILGADD